MLRSPVFLTVSAFFLVLSLTFAAILPQGEPSGMRVGILSEGEAATRATATLLQNEGYAFAIYDDRAALEHDVMTGALHCGYLLAETEPPVTALVTDGSYMRPLIDEIVLAAWLEQQVPPMAAAFLAQNGFDGANTAETVERLRGETTPMTVELRLNGAATADTPPRNSAQPLLYAVMISAFLAASLLSALLSSDADTRAQRQLAAFSGRPFATRAAPVVASVLLNAGVLLAADLLVSRVAADGAYPLAGRLVMIAALSVAAALLTLGASMLRRFSGVVVTLLPPALLVSVLCSGALVNPQYLPAGLGLLRFLSPAWYGLQLLQSVGGV